jgi:hypothetical protein
MSSTRSHKYVHVDSRERRDGETKARMTVNVPHGLNNCREYPLKVSLSPTLSLI